MTETPEGAGDALGVHASPKPGALRASELLRGAREVQIHHAGQVYRLRLTRRDKLILTK